MSEHLHRPCEFCGARLRVDFAVALGGELVDEVRPCSCADARWRRGECIVCGVRVPRTHPGRLGPKRCRTHHVEARRQSSRESTRRAYRRDPELARARRRVSYWAHHEKSAATSRERSAEYRRLRRKLLGRRRRRARHAERDAAIRRRVLEQGVRQAEVAREFGLSRSRVCEIINGKARDRHAAERRAA